MTAIDTSTAAVTALMDGVTDGPWTTGKVLFDCVFAGGEVVSTGGSEGPKAEANARFIAAARQLVPALLAERDALAGAVKVKPLVWPDFRDGGTCGHPHHFQYFVTQDHHGSFWSHFDMGEHKTLDDAKAHCDQHYQRAAIQPDPEARQAALAKAFCMGRDMAAAWHEGREQDELAIASKYRGGSNPWFSHCQSAKGHKDASDAIRALTPPADLAAKIGGE